MTSVLSVASSSSSLSHYSSAASTSHAPLSPTSIHSNRSARSSTSSLASNSLENNDDENVTITSNRLTGGTAVASPNGNGSRGTLRQRGQSEDDSDLRLLAISTHITELSYTISDIQTRIFEIQELRHKSQSQTSGASSPNGKDNNVSSIIDQSLMSLDERLESVEKGIKVVTENMEPYNPPPSTPTTAKTITNSTTPTASSSLSNGKHSAEVTALLRKYTALLADWESVQQESDVLRDELKEDKWLTVFRTVTDQADGMMSSLEKAVNRCQDFIFQVLHRRAGIASEDFFSVSTPSLSRTTASDRQPLNLDTFNTLLDSYEAKKKHYMPATSKVLAIIDRGVRDRVTKNGETLRRHSESAQRWKSLCDRIARTDSELENVRRVLLGADPAGSEAGSSTSGTHPSTSQGQAGYLTTPLNGPARKKAQKSEKSGTTLSRSISPFRKFARKFTGGSSSSKTTNSPTTPVISPLSVAKKLPKSPGIVATISAPPTTQAARKSRTSLFPNPVRHDPLTPERPGHKHSQSVTPESSPRLIRLEESTNKSYYGTLGKGRSSLSNGTPGTPGSSTSRPTWNGSTKVEPSPQVIKGAGTPSRPSSRPPSATGMYKTFSGNDVPPVPPLNITGTPYRRSLSRASMSSSRPWSPLGSGSISTSQSSSHYHTPIIPMSHNSSFSAYSTGGSRYPSRPPSRAQTPSRSVSHSTALSIATTPRPRPKTPSHIPGPSRNFRSISSGASDWSPGNMYSPNYYNRSFSPTFSVSGQSSTGAGGTPSHPPRPPSRSMIPVPSVHLSAASPGGRSTSSMSYVPGGYNRAGAESPTLHMSQFKSTARRAQTPDLLTMSRSVSSGRPSIIKLPPSSFRDGTISASTSSRPNSRTGSHTPSLSMFENASKLSLQGENVAFFGPEYHPNPKDPLDVEVAKVVNSVPHGLVIERVDPPLTKPPRDGEEVNAKYAFSNPLGRKVITVRLSWITRATRVALGGDAANGTEGTKSRVTMTTTKKVMCRVGGGWQDLNLYLLSRQGGI